ncbi:CTD phosphatase Fcp1 [Tilletia horrida]|uniref:protein-serine/threonine phosphatase n=1 Tax=Tilletia horrida TaxID=155126 RepID=A0AAN6GGM6_9BASI|nr:CTD phosphatase Fcp1 [Tilletia horrida]
MGEPCTHPVQVSGLCAICGVELESLPPDERPGAVDDEPVSILHSHASLKVTRSEAARLHAQSTSDLLTTRRLALIIDLDQTVIHATVDPTVGEWMKDRENPNFGALRDVKRFRLGTDGKPVPKVSKATRRARTKRGAQLATKAVAAGADMSAGSAEGKQKRDGDKMDEADDDGGDDEDEEGDDREEESEDEAEEEEDEDNDEDPNAGCWYYIKPRPGLPAFLRRLATLYELHVYTMGTRSYATSVCAIIDPDGTLFADRILSRDENDDGASAALANPNNSAAAAAAFRKSLARLFPVDTSMVVIIDDRADVWKWSPNLVKVVPFDFFVGIGDINASFLPAAPSAQLPTPPATPPSDGVTSTSPSPSDAASFASSDPAAASSLSADASAVPALATSDGADAAQRVALETQAAERPLAKMQEALEEEEAAADSTEQKQSEGTNDAQTSGDVPSSSAGAASAGASPSAASAGTQSEQKQAQLQHRAAVLKEDDRELDRLQRILNDIHSRWYAEWDRVQQETNKKGNNLGAALARMPDVANMIAQMKSKVLRGCHIVFSGVVPLGQNLETSEPWRTATEFGARCYRDLTSSVTHLVAARGGTAKVYQAQRQKHPRIWIVRPRWLTESCERWERSAESAHELVEGSAAAVGAGGGARPGPPPAQPPLPAALPSRAVEEEAEGELTRMAEDTDDDDEEEEEDEGDAASGGAPGGGATPAAGASMSAFGGFEALDWGEAADEVDAFLDGLDDEGDTTDGGYGSDASVGRGGLADRAGKRSRAESEESEGGAGGSGTAAAASATATEGEEPGRSPLSKRRRIASARAGQSKLKHSFDPTAPESEEEDDRDGAGSNGHQASGSTGGVRSRLVGVGASGTRNGVDSGAEEEDEEEDGDDEDEEGMGKRRRKEGDAEDEDEDDDDDEGVGRKRHSLFRRRAAGKSSGIARVAIEVDDDKNAKKEGPAQQTAVATRGDGDEGDDDDASVGSQIDESFLDGLADEIALDLEEGD